MYSYVKLINESFDKRLHNESVGTDVAKYQRWVDYDMERYHKISDKTMDEIRKAGLSVVKDQYGEYEVIAYSMKESVEDAKSILNEAPGGPVVNLRKYGWVASPEENFSDDGSYFTVYRYYPEGKTDEKSNFRLSRTNYQGDTYISIRYSNPATGKNVYIDDLNGVPRAVAVEQFPQVMEKVKALYDREKNEGPSVRNLTPEEVDKIKEIILQIVDLTGSSVWNAYEKALDKLGIDGDDVPETVERTIKNEISAEIRNKKSYDKAIIKKLAAQYLKDVIEKMRTGYTYGGKYKNGYDLERALRNGTALIDDPSGNKNYIHISDLPDAVQEQIRNWARNRIEKLYDFDIED